VRLASDAFEDSRALSRNAVRETAVNHFALNRLPNPVSRYRAFDEVYQGYRTMSMIAIKIRKLIPCLLPRKVPFASERNSPSRHRPNADTVSLSTVVAHVAVRAAAIVRFHIFEDTDR
jgi:hypothetical protein